MGSRKKVISILCLLLMLGVISGMTAACEGSFFMIVENQTNQHLRIYLHDSYVSTALAGGQTGWKLPMAVNSFPIVAKTFEGEVVFSKTYSRQQMQYIGDGKYKVVIPASVIK